MRGVWERKRFLVRFQCFASPTLFIVFKLMQSWAKFVQTTPTFNRHAPRLFNAIYKHKCVGLLMHTWKCYPAKSISAKSLNNRKTTSVLLPRVKFLKAKTLQHKTGKICIIEIAIIKIVYFKHIYSWKIVLTRYYIPSIEGEWSCY